MGWSNLYNKPRKSKILCREFFYSMLVVVTMVQNLARYGQYRVKRTSTAHVQDDKGLYYKKPGLGQFIARRIARYTCLS